MQPRSQNRERLAPFNARDLQGIRRCLERDGIVGVGCKVSIGQVLVNKVVPKDISSQLNNARDLPPDAYRPQPLVFKERADAYIDQLILTSNADDYFLIKLLMRTTRRPELGDKFSSRHGQKGVTGIIVPQQDMPFTEEGICPDLIMNPHGFPSRMTVGKLLEMLGGKASLMNGHFADATAFASTASSVEAISDTLVLHGYHFGGKELLTSGITGEPIKSCVAFERTGSSMRPLACMCPCTALTCVAHGHCMRAGTSSPARSTTRSSSTWSSTRCTRARAALGRC